MSLAEVINRGVVGVPERVSGVHINANDPVLKVIQARARMVAFIEANSKNVDNQVYDWWSQGQLYNGGTVTDVYTVAGPSGAYASGGVAGTELFINVALADAKKIREGHLMFIYDSTTRVFRRARVTGITLNGASSYATVILLETDTANALASSTLSFVLSNAHGEKSGAPSLISRDVTKFTNHCQFIYDADGMTIFENLTAERITPKAKARAAQNLTMRFREAKQLAFILGKYFEQDGTDGRWQTTDGFITAIETNEPDNVFDFSSDTNVVAGSTWAQEGMTFLENIAEKTSRTGEAEKKIVFTSSLMMTRLQQAIRNRTEHQIKTGEDSYGLKVDNLVMPGQDWEFRVDRTMSKYPMLQDLMLVTEPQLIGQQVFKPMETFEVPRIHANDPWQMEITEVSGFQYWNLEAMAVVKYASVNTA